MSSLDELFNKDPLSLTKDDRAQIIQAQRDNRAAWLAGEKVKKPKTEAAKPFSLDDLGI